MPGEVLENVNKSEREHEVKVITSLASSSRIGAPPISNMTRPVGTLETKKRELKHNSRVRWESTCRVAQYSNVPFPLPIRVSLPWNSSVQARTRRSSQAF